MGRVLRLAAWAYAVWVVLTWTRTAEQLAVGVAVALAVAASCSALGPVAAPWRVPEPRRLTALARLLATVLRRILVANVVLARRVWSPRRPLRSGMLVVPTELRSEGGVAAVGLLTSLIVDNQLVDLDLDRRRLQYHAVWVETTDPDAARERINAPVERLLRPLEGRGG